MIRIERLDHLVLTVASIAATVDFYEKALGMRAEIFGGGRTALKFGGQKINLHERGQEFEPKAERPTPGSGDLCFLSSTPLPNAISHLATLGIAIELGPVERMGAIGPMLSIYIRDPDRNLIEISNSKT
jgi:catechol 2,3-dioxygenase-like lactoylglutathione lyase family enzyme